MLKIIADFLINIVKKYGLIKEDIKYKLIYNVKMLQELSLICLFVSLFSYY